MEVRIIRDVLDSLQEAAPKVRGVLDMAGGKGASVRIKMDSGDTFFCMMEDDGWLRIEYLQKPVLEHFPSGDGFLAGNDPGDENDFGEVEE